MPKKNRDITAKYSKSEFVSKLRRLADSIEGGKNFEIQIEGERIYVPDHAEFSVEHEREEGEQEIEFQVRWKI